MAAIGLYSWGRYAGQWAETDSAAFTTAIRSFASEGQLIPAEGWVYPNGYAYQAISSSIIALTGLDVVTLQQILYPILAALVVLPAWALYRELAGSTRGATITTVLLLTQPEFLFVVLRSSHEKFTRTLMFLCLFLLVRSFKPHIRPRSLFTYIAPYSIAAFGLVATNNLFAQSFVLAIAAVSILGWLLARRNTHLQQQTGYMLPGLLYATLISFALVYIFSYYIYPPAQHDLSVLQNVWDRVTTMFQDIQAQAISPYNQVGEAWAEPKAFTYFYVSSANWIILSTSLIVWINQGVRWLWRGKAPATQMDWFLWVCYAAFAAQGALSVVADLSGVLSANLEHRIFPSFSMIAVALVGVTLARWRPGRFARPLGLGLSLGVLCIAVLSVLKATNEPVLSNKWVFYQADELAVLDWSDAHLKDAEIWTEFDERLAVAFVTQREDSVNNNLLSFGTAKPSTRNIILTTITRLRSSRLNRPLPVPPDALRVYDNGEAELYHLRPVTPYQP